MMRRSSIRPYARANRDGPSLIHREILQLVLLIAVAVAAFFLTRVIAASNRDMRLRDAAEWYQRGQRQLAAGDAEGAVDSFRHARIKDRIEKRYVLALARALAGTHQDEAARSALLALRESAPEDREINLELARMAADRQDVTEAVRFYHNVLYAPWPVDQATARRQVRVELVRFLLTHEQTGRAVAELVALSTDLPDDAPSHVQIAQLFAAAGDSRRALDQFQRALRLAGSGPALAGAGEAAFRIGDYPLARKYLRRAPDDLGGVKQTRELVELVLSHDPLAPRLGSSARRRRLTDDFSYAEERLKSCLEQHRRADEPPDELTLWKQAEAFKQQVAGSAILEEDSIESGVELLYRLERDLSQHCAPAPLDRALILIGQRHGFGGQ